MVTFWLQLSQGTLHTRAVLLILHSLYCSGLSAINFTDFQMITGASVNLTVEGGVDLVDEICPGIVTLFCEGVDINQLRWRYNGDTNIFMYSSDSSPSQSQPSQTFLSVELVAISQNTVDPDRANFTSILTADLSRLQSDNVMNIECGDAAIFQIESVNVQIIDRSRPRDPRFSMVTTEYQSKRLNSVQVQWRKSVS